MLDIDLIFLSSPVTNLGVDTFVPRLGDFFKRIQYQGSQKPTLQTLKELQYRFLLTFPFENLSIHGLPHYDGPIPVSIKPDIVETKLLDQGRGGYCFELNQYFYYVLRALGFKVIIKSARVIFRVNPTISTPRSHIFSVVHFEDTNELYLCDVGFGGNSPIEPLLLTIETPQSTIYDTYRIVPRFPSTPSAISHRILQLHYTLATNQPPDILDHLSTLRWMLKINQQIG